ncbi:MAG: Nif3-like dinuclear metal center hexameric protein [Verrucomicrobia bacterium]|nr:Nif3-like dinuclear metal center hexameric protein [Verrucomicrobiota bacterium]
MASLSRVVDFLDRELRIAEIVDYPGALNGLQLQNPGTVTRVAAAVDASLPVVKKAIAAGADLLLVHHGMFWQGAQPLRGAFYEKIRCAMDAELAIYSAHLPLDVHPRLGNNAALARAIGMGDSQPFLPWKGLPIGLQGRLEVDRTELLHRLEAVVAGKVHCCPAGPDRIRTVGLCTGGAGSEVARAAGLDAFITGEGPHWSYSLAEELGINLYYAGHYATETFGVRLLASELAAAFSLECQFIDHPSGL